MKQPEFFWSSMIGLARDIVKFIEPQSEADPAALLIQLLTAFGNALNRGAYFMTEADYQRANIFAVLVGDSSKGRKGSSWGHILRLFEVADPEWKQNNIKSGLTSGEGVIWAVRDAIDGSEDLGVSDKRLLAYESEFAIILRTLGREGNTLSAVTRLAWDRGDLQTLTKNSPARATEAHISIIGHITKDELTRYLDSTEAANGFGNRFLWIYVQRSKCLPEGGALDAAVFNRLALRLQAALFEARKIGRMSRSEDARQLWASIYPQLSEGERGLFGAVTARAEAQVTRLSMLYALLDGQAVISEEHLGAAHELWLYSYESARYIFGDSLGDPKADQVLKLIRDSLDGVTRTHVHKYFRGHLKAEHLDRILETLKGKTLIRSEIASQEGGRSIETWYAVQQ